MKIKAIILTLLFLLGGSGLSIDIAQCCNSFAGLSIGFSDSHEHDADSDCCACIKPVKKKKNCCEDIVLQTVINQVPAINKTSVSLNKIQVLKSVSPAYIFLIDSPQDIVQISSYEEFDNQYPVPILLRKRVLQI